MKPVRGDANWANGLTVDERVAMHAEVEAAVAHLLDALRVDYATDPGMQRTPHRVASMLVNETLSGRFEPCPNLTDFPNETAIDELYVVGPVTVRSTCAHHLAPVVGQAWIGVLPSERIIGLSKFSRVVQWVMARLQMQERATQQIADVLEQALQPRGLGVVVRARHLCMTWRGVREHGTDMTTSVMRGLLRENAAARAECLTLMKDNGL